MHLTRNQCLIKRYNISHISHLFGTSRQDTRVLFKNAQKFGENEGVIRTGRPPLLELNAENEVKDFIISRLPISTSISVKELQTHIKNTHNIQVQLKWIKSFIKKNEEDLKLVKSQSIEKERSNITQNIIQNHFNNLETFIEKIHPLLLFNADESSLGEKIK